MSMKKKALAAASYVMVAALAIGGTVAYLTDTDNDVNVMTLGNVSIDQHEYERKVNEDGAYESGKITDNGKEYDSYLLKEFTQGKPLIPTTKDPSAGGDWDATTVRMSQVDSYGGMQVFEAPNAQDKFVTVENTGRNDAYIRTLVAIEVGSADQDLIGVGYHSTWTKNEVGVTEIDGNNYYVLEFTYDGGLLSDGTWRHKNGVLPAGDTSYPNLSQVYMKAIATNEDVVAIDGDGNGRLDIRVLSQAVQADGFEDAKTAFETSFGAANAANVKAWFEADDTVAAKPAANAVRPVGYEISTEGEVINHLVIKDESDAGTNLRALYNGESKSDYTKEDIVIMNSHLDGTYAMNLYAVADSGAELVVSDTELKGWVSYTGFASAYFTNCKFGENSNAETYKTVRPYDTTVFKNCEFEAGYTFLWDMLGAGDTVTFENCTIDGVAITEASQVSGTAAVTVK